jgi:hypothetical protein
MKTSENLNLANSANQTSNNKPSDSQPENTKTDKENKSEKHSLNNSNYLANSTSQLQNNLNTNNIQTIPVESEVTEKNKKRILNLINKNMLDDLDAIYFFDKINMRTKSATHNNVPKLNFNFLDMESSKNKKPVFIFNIRPKLTMKKNSIQT